MSDHGRKIAILLGVAGVAGLGAGLLAGFVGRFLHLILLFPLVMGGLLAVALTLAIKAQRMRSAAVAVVLGVVGGVSAWTADMGMRYLHERAQVQEAMEGLMAEELGVSPAELEPERVEAFVDHALKTMGGADPPTEAELDDLPRAPLAAAWGWFNFRAENTTIGKAGRSGSDTPIPKVAAFLLWLVEFSIMTGVACGGAVVAANEPFCELCDRYYASGETIPFAGEADKERVVAALTAGDGAALQNLYTPDVSYSIVTLELRRCACGESPLYVAAGHHKPKKKKGNEVEVTKLWAGYLPAACFEFLRQPTTGEEGATPHEAGDEHAAPHEAGDEGTA